MEKFDNYSPEIPLLDDVQDQDIPVNNQPEPAVAPRRRRVRNTTDKTQEQKKKTQQATVKKDTTPKESVFSRVKAWASSTVTRTVTGIILGGLGFWFAVAFISYFASCIQDQSLVSSNAIGDAAEVVNSAGEGGARLTELVINRGFGVGAIVIVVWLVCMSLKLLVGYPRFRSLDFTIKSLVALISISVVVGMLSIGMDTMVNWGGFHGRFINERIYEFIGWSGAIILSVVLVAIFVVICMRDVIKWIMKKKRAYDEKKRIRREAYEAQLRKEEAIREMERREFEDQVLSGEGVDPTAAEKTRTNAGNVEFDPNTDTIFDIPELDEVEDTDKASEVAAEQDPDSLDVFEEYPAGEAETSQTDLAPDSTADVKGSDNHDDELANPEAKKCVTVVKDENAVTDGVEKVEKVTEPEQQSPVAVDRQAESPAEEPEQEVAPDVMTVNVNQIEKGSGSPEPSYDSELFTHDYKFPPSDYLRPGVDKISVDAEEQMENKEKIRKTLLDFGIPITSIEATVGPTVTLYEIRPDTGVKIAKIRNLVDDIALSLAAIGVRIIAPIPGKGTVGIEVANKEPQTVSMRTIIQSRSYQESRYRLPIALGSTISNDVYIADLAKMPHLLVAGATGQGKSVGLNAIITSLLYSKRPEELKFVMVDPKRVEFSLYSKIEKYYLAKIPDSNQPIITNMENVVATLSSLCVEMDERYKLLEKAFVRQVHEYNEKFRDKRLDPRDGHRFMPYIVVIIDEFADLIMTAGKEVELPIARLAQLARAVGIHVIIATQRPSTNVITGMIKANFPVRIAFKVSSGIDSKTILDSTGAQQLIGRGDMLISNNGEMVRVQCAFVDTPEVEEVCDYIARQPYPQGPYILPEPQVGGDSDATEVDPSTIGKKDPLFEEVARQVVMSGVASTSAVQRRYEIGYNRAGRIMDQLEVYGIVGPATGGKPRNVLVDPNTLEGILATLA